MKSWIIVAVSLISASSVCAQTADGDSVTTTGTSKFKNWLNTLIHGNIDRTYEKKLDISFIAAPCYTKEGSVGIGGAATGLYRLDCTDSVMQPSDISLTGSATIKGFYTLSANGNNHFKGNKSRLSYTLSFYNKNLDFWGVSYAGCSVNPMSKYKRQQIKLETDYVYKLTKSFHAGAAFNLNYTKASDLLDAGYLEGQKRSYLFAGVGFSLQYDTRDFILNPKRGVYFMIREVFYPEFMSNHDKTVFSTTVVFDAYRSLWKGSVLAYDFYGQFNNGGAPWALREELGSGTRRMRGYYSGRYIDTNYLATQLELRQHIYGRLGCVVWGGAGSVFPKLEEMRMSRILPNYGLGLRVEFKKNVNVRIDYGFGKGTAGLVCQFAEAF